MGHTKYLRPAITGMLALAAGVLAAAHAQTPLLGLDVPNLPTGSLTSSAADGVCVMPWAANGDETLGPEDYWGLDPTGLHVVTDNLDPVADGTLGPLSVYGIGAHSYKESIVNPCTHLGSGGCAEEILVWVGDTLECRAIPGKMASLTSYAMKDRWGMSTDCDALTYDEALALAGTELCQDRAIFIPIIDAFPFAGSSGSVEILGIETFYIAGWDRYPPYGSEDINGDTVPDDAMLWGYFLFNQPPDCSLAVPSITEIWPPNHKMANVNILGVTDADGDPIDIVITHITQDEPVDGLGDAHTAPDGAGVGTNTAQVRAERTERPNAPGDGRMYHIHFEASDGEGGVCSGLVNVGVPHNRRPGGVIADGGELYDSTLP